MSGLDIFAWIVLCILVASIIAVFCIADAGLGTSLPLWSSTRRRATGRAATANGGGAERNYLGDCSTIP